MRIQNRITCCLLAVGAAGVIGLAAAVGGTAEARAEVPVAAALSSAGEGMAPAAASGGQAQQMMYGIGSTSKMMTAAAVMKLAEEGRIGLDTPLTTYIPEFEMDDSRYVDITPRMLLNHSSGLPGSTLTNAMLLGDPDTYNHDHLLEALSSQRLKADPGAYSTYCNDGFTLAEIVVERVTGMPYTEYLEQTFFEPMGLTGMTSPQGSVDPDRLAPVYDEQTGWELPYETANVIGSGGLYATAEDLCRFARIFMTDGNSGGLLLQDSLEQMMESTYGSQLGIEGHDTTLEYGLGWDSVNTYPFNRYGIRALTKGGDTSYYHSSLTVLPEEGIACAVLSSGGTSISDQIAVQEILLEYLDEIDRIDRDEAREYLQKAEAEPEPEPEPGKSPDKLNQWSGWYAGREMFKVEMDGQGELAIAGSGDGYGRPQTYEYGADGKFYSTGSAYISSEGSLSKGSGGQMGRSELEFKTAADGREYLMAGTHEIYPGLGRTAVYLPLAMPVRPEEGLAPINGGTLKAWEARDGREYYLVSEKSTSAAYFNRFMAKLEIPEEPAGYLAFKDTLLPMARLKDPMRAEFFQQVPGQAGRDLEDYEIIRENGREYLVTGSSRYLSGENIGWLPEADGVITLGADGQAQWFRTGEAHVNRPLVIEVPERGSYFIYDHGSRDVTCAASSFLGPKERQITLPKDGRIVFVGEAGDQFSLKYVRPAGS